MLFHAVKHEYSITTKNLSFIIILIIFPGVFDVLTLPSLLSKQTHPRKYVRLYVSKRSVFSVLCSSYLVSDNVSTARWRRRYFTPPFPFVYRGVGELHLQRRWSCRENSVELVLPTANQTRRSMLLCHSVVLMCRLISLLLPV